MGSAVNALGGRALDIATGSRRSGCDAIHASACEERDDMSASRISLRCEADASITIASQGKILIT
jgi:hypothetical protein